MRTFIATLAVFVLSLPTLAQKKNQTESQIKLIRDFYTAYVTANSKIPTDAAQVDALTKKYCTKKVLEQLQDEELDYDIFVNAQDFDTEWLKSLTITKDTPANSFIVTYDMNFEGEWAKIRLTLAKEGGTWKIASVKS